MLLVIYVIVETGTSDLPDMYAQSPRTAGPRAEGIHIRQSQVPMLQLICNIALWQAEVS